MNKDYDKDPFPNGARVTDDPAKARSFRGQYLLGTMWEWELEFNAVT